MPGDDPGRPALPGGLPVSPLADGPSGEKTPQAAPRQPGRFWPAIGRLLLFVILAVMFSLALAFALKGLPWLEDSDLVLGSLVLLPAAAGATVLLLTVSDRLPAAAICLPMNGLSFQHMAFGTVAGAGLSVSIVGLQWAAGWVEIQYGSLEGSLTEVMWAPSLGAGFFVIASSAAAEELLFRGYGLQQLMRATHAWAAVVLSSAVFGLVHATNPNSSTVGIVNTALFGMLFGLPLLRQRSLWIPTGMHFGWNFSLACLGANVSGLTIRLTGLEIVPVGPAEWSGAEYGPEASLLTTLAVVAAAVALWRMPLRTNQARVLWDRDPPPESSAASAENRTMLHLGGEIRSDRDP